MARVTVILYPSEVQRMRSWNGDIGRAVSHLMDGMVLGQRFLVSKNAKTGNLLRSLRVGPKQYGARGIVSSVGANPANGHGKKGVAYWNDQGTRAHVIRPRPTNSHGRLVFYWARVGHVVHFRKVNHPGNRAYDWAMSGASVAMATWSANPGALVLR